MKRIVHLSIALLAAFLAAHAQASDLQIAFTSPLDGAVSHSPINLNVLALESSNTIVTAEFFANGESIGTVGNYGPLPIIPNPPGSIGITVTEIFTTIHLDSTPDLRSYSLAWQAQPGDYTLTARATDDQGNTADTAPINVTIIPRPIVSVEPSVPIASSDEPGIFTITRNYGTNADLQVPFFLLGPAENGVDYKPVTNFVIIPAGQFSADVAIEPLVFHPGYSKGVTLQLYNYSIPGGGGPGPVPLALLLDPPYLVDSLGEAIVFIKASDRDPHKPVVRITRPGRGHSFGADSDITITAKAFDRDTDVSVVEFFDRTTKLGETFASTLALPGEHVPFSFTWTNAPAGLHVLRARAKDNQGKVQVSRSVKIRVLRAQ